MGTVPRRPQPAPASIAARAEADMPKGVLARWRARLPARLPLLVLVFVAGMASLAVEFCASRLLAPFFGTTLFVWANLIGLILIYLSSGYFIGGRLADRYPTPRVLCALTAVAAVAIGLIPFISQPVLEWSVRGLSDVNVGV